MLWDSGHIFANMRLFLLVNTDGRVAMGRQTDRREPNSIQLDGLKVVRLTSEPIWARFCEHEFMFGTYIE